MKTMSTKTIKYTDGYFFININTHIKFKNIYYSLFLLLLFMFLLYPCFSILNILYELSIQVINFLLNIVGLWRT